MKTFHFKTNIHSANSIQTIIDYFDKNPSIKSWTLDTNSKDFPLETIVEDQVTENEIIELACTAGFKIELIPRYR